MYVDPISMSWAFILGASWCAFMVGKYWGGQSQSNTIEDTIAYLCEEGYVKHKHNSDGEIEIIKINEE